MSEGDPKTESARIEQYPAQLIGSDDDREEMLCKYPGCEYRGPGGKEVVDHINQEHPLKDIECSRCKVKTRLQGKRWCEDCVDVCEPQTISDEEIKKHRDKVEAAKKKSEERKTTREDPIEPEPAEETTMTTKGATRSCNVCGKPTKGYKCDDCKGGNKTEKRSTPGPRREKTQTEKRAGESLEELEAMRDVVERFQALSEGAKTFTLSLLEDEVG